MPQFGDFLNRFRPAGAPGAATRAGVPADRAAELSAELEPVLGLLASADSECARLIAEAEQEASRIAAQAREKAAGIAAGAAAVADQARASAADEVLATARRRAEDAEREAAAEVAARSAPDEDDIQVLIGVAIELVWAQADGGQAP